MPFAIDPNHRKFFRTQGWVELEGVFQEKDQKDLHSPTLSILAHALRRLRIGQLLFALADKAPLRIVSFTTEAKINPFTSLPGDQWGVLFNLTSGNVIFCTPEGFEALDLDSDADYLFVVLTANFLNHDRHPIIYRP